MGLVFQRCRSEHCWKSKGLGTEIFWNHHSSGVEVFQVLVSVVVLFYINNSVAPSYRGGGWGFGSARKIWNYIVFSLDSVITIENPFDSSYMYSCFSTMHIFVWSHSWAEEHVSTYPHPPKKKIVHLHKQGNFQINKWRGIKHHLFDAKGQIHRLLNFPAAVQPSQL